MIALWQKSLRNIKANQPHKRIWLPSRGSKCFYKKLKKLPQCDLKLLISPPPPPPPPLLPSLRLSLPLSALLLSSLLSPLSSLQAVCPSCPALPCPALPCPARLRRLI